MTTQTANQTAIQNTNETPNIRRYSRRQAEQIALEGVARMWTQFYVAEQIAPNRYIVRKQDGTEYKVYLELLDGVGGEGQEIAYCNCPFCSHGRVNLTCKHIEFVRSWYFLLSPYAIQFVPMIE